MVQSVLAPPKIMGSVMPPPHDPHQMHTSLAFAVFHQRLLNPRFCKSETGLVALGSAVGSGDNMLAQQC